LTGLVAGVLLGLLLARGPGTAAEPDVAHYREVRDYTRQAFVREVTDEHLLEAALHGLADGLDEYSQYFNLAESELLQRETSGRYFGLGVVLGRPFEDGQILFPLANGPALAAGVRVGDRIVEIGGQKFEDVDQAGFRQIVSGNEPHDVLLVLLGLDGKERTLTVRTAEVVEPTVRHERVIDEARKIGYVAVTGFSHETPDEFAAAIQRLKGDGMRGLIVDLRENPGGVLVSAVAMARMFVAKGLIVSTEGRGDPVRYEAVPGAATCTALPLVVLVDEGTASASEVFAAAVQEHRAGVIVGSPTFGKGMVQTLHRFGDPGPVIKVSTSYYYTPSHTNLEHSADPAKPRGIQPDLHVPITNEERQTLRERLARPSPSRECQAAIAAWERERGKPVVERIPVDTHIAAAIDLFGGQRPGPEPRRSTP
jgi:carboxyl-terminal processing protease